MLRVRTICYDDVYLRTIELQCNGATELACEANLLSSAARNGRVVSCANVSIVSSQKVSSLTGQFVSVVCEALLLEDVQQLNPFTQQRGANMHVLPIKLENICIKMYLSS